MFLLQDVDIVMHVGLIVFTVLTMGKQTANEEDPATEVRDDPGNSLCRSEFIECWTLSVHNSDSPF